MTIADFTRILDHLPHLVVWSPHGYNEPLLHPRFFDFCQIADHRNIRLSLVTNGTLLGPQATDRLLTLNPLQIRVSIEGVGKAYEHIRRGAKWHSIYRNLQYLAYATAKKDVPLSLYVTVWRNNIQNIPALIALAEELNLPIKFTDITWQNEWGESKWLNALRETFTSDQLRQLVRSSDKISVRFGITKKQKRACTLPWSSIYIDVTGETYPCTDNLTWPMGNLIHEPIKQIYNSAFYQQFREASLTGTNDACKNCVSWGPDT